VNVASAVARLLKLEGVEFLIAYPTNPLIESAAEAGIRTVIVRQERVGVHMADAIARVTSGDRIGVFAMQHGPGVENSFGAVAQAYAESAPILVLPAGYAREHSCVDPHFNSFLNFQHITKSVEQLIVPEALPDAMRRAFSRLRSGRPRPVMLEFPTDVLKLAAPSIADYKSPLRVRSGPDPRDVLRAAEALLGAQRPVLYAGQGVHYAKAWPQLRRLAELIEAPVATSLHGKSAFPETHGLSLGSGGYATSRQLRHFLDSADLIFGIGCSFTGSLFNVPMPKAGRFIHATLDANDLNKDVACELGLVGDAGLVLDALLEEVAARVPAGGRGRLTEVTRAIRNIKDPWLSQWMPRLTSDSKPLSPYRVIWDLYQTVDPEESIITHDAGSPRDQMTPFWLSTRPLSYLGWGNTTQLGYGLGLALGAKLIAPEKLCINVWGDAAVGFTGMDFETAVRERLPILSIVLNNSCMACDLEIMPAATEKFRSTDVGGNYADLAQALGGYGERVSQPAAIVPAIRRGIAKTKDGIPALLEFITEKATDVSLHR
jgi:thiamine pyrophosphate-dependent acetolactate synthase large subunit-like protein